MPRSPSAPPTTADRRTVLLFLAALSARPVEGEAVEAMGERPPIYLHRSAVSAEWSRVSGLLDVRRALRRSTRTLGRTGFVAALQAISVDARAVNQAVRSIALKDYDDAVRAERAEAEEQHRPVDFAALRAMAEDLDFPLADSEPDNDCAASHRRTTGQDLVRLRRDVDGEAFELWERLADTYGSEDSDPAEWECLLEEAQALGFDLASPIPASAVQRITAWERDDEEPDDEDGPAPSGAAPQPPQPPPAPWSFVTPSPTVAEPPSRGVRPTLTLVPAPPPPREETVEEWRERFKAEHRAAEAETELRRQRAANQPVPRQWECQTCTHYDRSHYSVIAPSLCGLCRGETFAPL